METKDKRSERRHRTEVVCEQQLRIAKQKNMHDTNMAQQPHRMAKRHAMDCGKPQCLICGNPRKLFGKDTLQERKLKQLKFYKDDLRDEIND